METSTVNVYHQDIWITYWSYAYYRTEWNFEDRHADIFYKWKCVAERTPNCTNRFDKWYFDSVIDWHIVKSINELEDGLKKCEKYTYVRF